MEDHDYGNVGEIAVPSEFDHTKTLERGRPHHDKFDKFYKKHPFMSISKRAKIFSPFDALKGFSEALAEKEKEQ